MLHCNPNKSSEEKLEKMRGLLEEIEEERRFVLMQSAHHISGRTVVKYENEINDLKKDIAQLEQLVNTP